MKKNAPKKLVLHKETVRILERSLTAVNGGDSIVWSHCVSYCVPCDPDLIPPI